MRTFFFLFILFANLANAQLQNEIKFVGSEIVNGQLKFSYEYLLRSRHTLSLSAGVGLYTKDYTKLNFLLKTQYRFYTSKKRSAERLFFAASFLYEDYTNYSYPADSSIQQSLGRFFGYAPTLGIGYKYVFWKRIPVEIYYDLGIDISTKNEQLPNILHDGGLAVGYRF